MQFARRESGPEAARVDPTQVAVCLMSDAGGREACGEGGLCGPGRKEAAAVLVGAQPAERGSDQGRLVARITPACDVTGRLRRRRWR